MLPHSVIINLLKFSNLQSTFIEKPWIVTHLLHPMPIEATFLSPIHTPVNPSLVEQLILKHDAHSYALSISSQPEGIDFFFRE